MNQEWIGFAKENQAPELARSDIIGQPLENFIAGWETNHLYEIIFEKVRQSGREVQIPFRCDSPDRKRYFRMSIAPFVGEELEFTVKVIRIDVIPPRPLLDNSVEHSLEMVVICSWCKRIRTDDGRWVEIEEAAEKKELFGSNPPSLTYEVCLDCLSIIHRQLDK